MRAEVEEEAAEAGQPRQRIDGLLFSIGQADDAAAHLTARCHTLLRASTPRKLLTELQMAGRLGAALANPQTAGRLAALVGGRQRTTSGFERPGHVTDRQHRR